MLISRLFSVLVVLGFLGLAACGGGSSGSNPGNPDDDQQPFVENSKLYLSLTDAEGDFLSYEVAVSHISLTRANGVVVDVLPSTTRVDFAQYVEVSELVTLVSAPPGRYDSASMTLDFSAAVITVQGENGDALPAVAVDANNAPLGQLEVDIQFGDRDGFVLLPGRPAHLSLDFDLDASNTIDIDGDNATVTVDPVLIADVVLEELKPFRVRGLLGTVYPERSAFEVDLRPFRIREHAFGSMEILVDEETVFEINNELVENENGLTALAALGATAPIVALGEWNRQSHSFTVTEVRAGTSVPWGNTDALRGTVVARAESALTVRGASVEFANGTFAFHSELQVLISDTTRVVKVRDPQAGIEDISVGSAIFVSGEFTDDLTLDATNGSVRIVAGNISGTVVSASPLALDVSFINGLRADNYNFSGTGISTENDADPDYYEIATATLPLSGIALGDPVRVKGWVVEFGSAPEDFEALSLRNAANVKGHLVVLYGSEGSATAIASLGDEGILFDLASAGTRHHMIFAGIPIDLLELEAGMPLLVPGGERGIFALSNGNRIVVSSFYSRFLDLLEQELESGSKVVHVDAHGYYDDSSNTFSSQRFRVQLSAASE